MSAPAEPTAADPSAGDAPSADPISERSIGTAYQPVVDLYSGEVVAYEGLARGPEGGSLFRPAGLFSWAASEGRIEELDWVCRAAAVAGAIAAGLPRDLHLFVNADPSTSGARCPDDLQPVFAAAKDHLQVVVEVTERDLLSRPADVLTTVRTCREFGWHVALDDVGVSPESLALLPLIRPEVVKLDKSLIQRRSTADVAFVVTSVMAYAERTGAIVVAEGVETEEQRDRAIGYGATHAQGWLFARPGPLPTEVSLPATPLVLPAAQEPASRATPFSLVRDRNLPTRRASRRTLLAISHHLEGQATLPSPGRAQPVVLSAFQRADRFTPHTAYRYGEIASSSPFVAALAVDLPAVPAPGVRGASIAADDPLAGEWSVVVVGPRYAGALLAAEVDPSGGDGAFDFVVTHDPTLVLEAAQSLMGRVLPAEPVGQ